MKKCYLCGKKSPSGHNVSHSHQKNKRKWRPNIHRAQVFIGGKKLKIPICTRCLKAQY